MALAGTMISIAGKWDCFVSGGLAVGYGILETTIKEAAEEASVQGELVKKLVPAGCVRYVTFRTEHSSCKYIIEYRPV